MNVRASIRTAGTDRDVRAKHQDSKDDIDGGTDRD